LDKYNLRVELVGIDKSWVVVRSFSEFVALHQQLLNVNPSDESLHGFLNNASSLESGLRALLNIYNDKFWSTEPLLSFIEDVPKKSLLADLQISKLSQQVGIAIAK
jgi:hypothetical protein